MMPKKNLWRQIVETFARFDFFRHAVCAVFAVLLAPVLLYFAVSPRDPPMTNRAAVRGTIESAQIAPCLDRLRTSMFGGRACVDGAAITYRDGSGLMHTAVFHLPGHAPFDAKLYPRGGVVDVIMDVEAVNSGYNQRVDAVAVNGVVLKPLRQEGGLGERLGLFACALFLAFLLATFVGRLMLDHEARTKAVPPSKA